MIEILPVAGWKGELLQNISGPAARLATLNGDETQIITLRDALTSGRIWLQVPSWPRSPSRNVGASNSRRSVSTADRRLAQGAQPRRSGDREAGDARPPSTTTTTATAPTTPARKTQSARRTITRSR